MPSSYSEKSEKNRLSGALTVLLWMLLLCFISVVFMALVVWRGGSRVYEDATQAAHTVASAFQKSLNITPEVRVNSVVVIEATTPAKELVTAKKQLRVRELQEHTWLKSTKSFEIEATFTARAGFDFQIPLIIQVDSRNLGLNADLPPPRILAISMSDLRILQDEDGFWNKLTPADREKAFQALESRARNQFLRSDLLAKAGMEGEKLVRKVLETSAVEVGLSSPAPQ